MILVADSGSSKCDWILIDKSGKQYETSSMGFNPFFHNEDLIFSELSKNELFTQFKTEITDIYFFGAGASSDERKKTVSNSLKKLFTNANILVDHDLIGAAIATAEDEPGIACIIGTGSNSCYYDGKTVHEEIPALGYILGDEGSGSYFGKILTSRFLYKKLPEDIYEGLKNEFGLTKENIFENVYNKPNPNVYLGSFMRFVSNNREHPFFKELIYKGLSTFINTHVWCFENFREVPVHFVGSIAYFFKEVLEEVARNHRFTIGKITQKPVTALAEYYCKKHQITLLVS